MFDNIIKFFKKFSKEEKKESKETAKERLHLVLMQDRANVSADFLDLMKQEIIEVIKKYIDIDEGAMDVRLTNKENNDGTNGAPALYANIPIVNIKDEVRQTAQVEQSPSTQQVKKDVKKERHSESVNKDKEEKTKKADKIKKEETANKKETTKEENAN